MYSPWVYKTARDMLTGNGEAAANHRQLLVTPDGQKKSARCATPWHEHLEVRMIYGTTDLLIRLQAFLSI
jgi:hypothetical protein